jgi:hypothetical protein
MSWETEGPVFGGCYSPHAGPEVNAPWASRPFHVFRHSQRSTADSPDVSSAITSEARPRRCELASRNVPRSRLSAAGPHGARPPAVFSLARACAATPDV